MERLEQLLKAAVDVVTCAKAYRDATRNPLVTDIVKIQLGEELDKRIDKLHGMLGI